MVAVQGLGGREAVLLMGTAEIKESAERAAVFAVLDATNRWAEARRPDLGRSNKIQRPVASRRSMGCRARRFNEECRK